MVETKGDNMDITTADELKARKILAFAVNGMESVSVADITWACQVLDGQQSVEEI